MVSCRKLKKLCIQKIGAENVPESTHPTIATLGHPLFACGGKRVREKFKSRLTRPSLRLVTLSSPAAERGNLEKFEYGGNKKTKNSFTLFPPQAKRGSASVATPG